MNYLALHLLVRSTYSYAFVRTMNFLGRGRQRLSGCKHVCNPQIRISEPFEAGLVVCFRRYSADKLMFKRHDILHNAAEELYKSDNYVCRSDRLRCVPLLEDFDFSVSSESQRATRVED